LWKSMACPSGRDVVFPRRTGAGSWNRRRPRLEKPCHGRASRSVKRNLRLNGFGRPLRAARWSATAPFGEGSITMKITRRFTHAGQDPFASVSYERRTSRISNPDGSVVFEMNDAEIPAQWSQLATDIMVSKYFRKAGVPQTDEAGQVIRDASGNVVTGPEKSAKQVINRLAGCWRYWGEKYGYFDTT